MTADQLKQELADLDNEIRELRDSLEQVRTQMRSDGPQDSEDIAASLTNIEESEGALSALEARRERLQAQLGASGTS
jgi:predicted RNase H-like nuclease (RuvC/YqgF family)